jgi:hypothetical protein
MTMTKPRLDRTILKAFRIAHEAGRADVAEHLLCALECCCQGQDQGATDEAYRLICDDMDCSCRTIPHRTRTAH